MTTQPLSMTRRLDFAAKVRKPKQELWLGCVVTEVEEKISKSGGQVFLKIKFSNCPYVGVFTEREVQWLQQLGWEHRRKTRLPEVGDSLNVYVTWHLNPPEYRKLHKLAEYGPSAKIVLHDLLGEEYDIEPVEQIPVAIERDPVVGFVQRNWNAIKELMCIS